MTHARVLNGFAGMFVEIGTRVGPLYSALEVAAGVDPAARDLAEASQRRRLDDARKVVRRFVIWMPSPPTSRTRRLLIWSGLQWIPRSSTGWSV